MNTKRYSNILSFIFYDKSLNHERYPLYLKVKLDKSLALTPHLHNLSTKGITVNIVNKLAEGSALVDFKLHFLKNRPTHT